MRVTVTYTMDGKRQHKATFDNSVDVAAFLAERDYWNDSVISINWNCK